MLQPAEKIQKLSKEIAEIKFAACAEGKFKFEKVDRLWLQRVKKQLLQLKTSGSTDFRLFNLLGRVYCLGNDKSESKKYHMASIRLAVVPQEKASCFFDYGVTLGLFKEHEAALVELHKAVSENPDYIDSWIQIAQTHHLLKEDEKAYFALKKIPSAYWEQSATDADLMVRDTVLENYYPDESEFSEEFVENVLVAEKDVKAGHGVSFANIDDLEEHLKA